MPRKQRTPAQTDLAPLVNGALHKLNGKAPKGPIAPIAESIGVTGLKRWGMRGLVWEEFLTELRGPRGVKVYREMLDNDATIGAVMYVITVVLRQVQWEVRGGQDADVELVEQAMDDMKPSFTNFICEVLSMLGYGWSWHEMVWKRRNGPNADPSLSSKFTDGRIGWACWDIRSQDSLYEWNWDERGNLIAMLQQCPPGYQLRTIPLSRSMLFRPSSHKNSPEGRSLLRSAYESWYYKKHFRRVQAIGVERDLTGMPVCYLNGTLGATVPDGSTETVYQSVQRILRNLKVDEQENLILPGERDENGNRLCDFQLLASPGTRQIDVEAIIAGLATSIMQVMAADFLQLGHEKSGSWSLSSDKTDMFALSLGAILQAIADQINDVAIPMLMRFNGRPIDDCPKLIPCDIESPDLEKLGKYLNDLSTAGLPLWPNEGLERYALKAGNLPEPTEEERAVQAMTPEPPPTPTPQANAQQQMADELL